MNTSEKRLLSLINATQVITSSLDVATVLERLIEEVLHIIDGADAGVLFMQDTQSQRLIARHAIGYDLNYLKNIHLNEEGMTGKVFSQKRANIFYSHDDVAQNMLDLFPQYEADYIKAVGTMRYPKCAVCAPLLDKSGKAIGVFTIVNFSGTAQFTEDDLQLLQTFANQSMIAIENARLFTQNERTSRIFQALAMHDDLPTMTTILAKLIHAEICIINEYREIVALSAGSSQPTITAILQHAEVLAAFKAANNTKLTITIAEEPFTLHLCPIRTNAIVVGMMIAILPQQTSIDPLDLFAIEQAGHIFAVQLVGQQKNVENLFKYDGYLLQQLIDGQMVKSKELAHYTQFIMVALALAPNATIEEQEYFTRQLYQFFKHTTPRPLIYAAGVHYDILFMSANEDEHLLTTSHAQLSKLQNKLQLPFTAGIGRTFNDFATIRASQRDAKRCTQYLQSTGDEQTIISYQQLGPYRLFLTMQTDELEEYIALILGPILHYDKTNNSELLATLSHFIACKQNQAKTAEACFVHVNTIKYRLQMIYGLLQKNTFSSKDLFEIQLALYMKAFLKL